MLRPRTFAVFPRKGNGMTYVGCKSTSRKVVDSELERLQKKKYKLRMDIGAQTDTGKAKELQLELKEAKKATKKRMREVETRRIDNKMARLEAMKDDSARYFAALKEMNSKRKQETLSVKDQDGRTGTNYHRLFQASPRTSR